MKTTNYYDTFIEVAEDCPVTRAEIPPPKTEAETIATIEYDMPANKPYTYTSDDILFAVYAERNATPTSRLATERKAFFSKGQPCFSSSPLTKRYGWGVHSNAKGRIALYARESNQYKKFSRDKKLQHLKALRAKRA